MNTLRTSHPYWLKSWVFELILDHWNTNQLKVVMIWVFGLVIVSFFLRFILMCHVVTFLVVLVQTACFCQFCCFHFGSACSAFGSKFCHTSQRSNKKLFSSFENVTGSSQISDWAPEQPTKLTLEWDCLVNNSFNELWIYYRFQKVHRKNGNLNVNLFNHNCCWGTCDMIESATTATLT